MIFLFVSQPLLIYRHVDAKSMDDVILWRDVCAAPGGKWGTSGLLRDILTIFSPEAAQMFFAEDQSCWHDLMENLRSAKSRICRVLLLLAVTIIQTGAAIAVKHPTHAVFSLRPFKVTLTMLW